MIRYLARFTSTLFILGFPAVQMLGEFKAPEVPDGWVYYHDLEIGTVDGVTLSMELVAPGEAPDGPLPVIAYIHGGGWNHGSKDVHGKRLAGIARRGYIAASLMYRLTPQHAYPAQIEDILAAIRFLKANAATYHIAPDRINLWGSSAGGHLASLAGTAANDVHYNKHGIREDQTESVFSVVDFSGPNCGFLSSFAARSSSMRAFLGGFPSDKPDVATEAMPITHVDADDPPFFVAHGTDDRTVPIQLSRQFVEALLKAGGQVTYHEFEGAGHNITATHPEAQEMAWEFLRKLNFPDKETPGTE